MFGRIQSALLLLPLLATHVSASQEPGSEEHDLSAVAKSLAAYLEARGVALGVPQSLLELRAELDELRKARAGVDPLQRAADLGLALWLSRDYPTLKSRRGKVTSDVFKAGSFKAEGIPYSYRVPRGYRPGDNSYPLIIAIPDEDETTEDHIRDNWSLRQVRDGAIVVSPEMPENREEWDRVMVDGRPGGLSHVLTVLRVATERFAVDSNRIFVAGRGKGVPAAIAAGNCSPQRFAGVIGRAGDAGELAPDNYSNLPTFLANGGAHATRFQEAVEKLGFNNCRVEPAGREVDVWAWMVANPRNPFPASITIVPANSGIPEDPFPTRAYWLRVAPSSPTARATAKADRETGTIEISTTDVSQVIVYLNDEILDLDEPVKIICNGVEHTPVIARHLPSTLDMLEDGTSDTASVYVALAIVDSSQNATAAIAANAPQVDADLDQRLAAAGVDTAQLWELHGWCRTTQRAAAAERVLHRLLRLAPDHSQARAAAGHVSYMGQWFGSQSKVDSFKLGQQPEIARAKGHVQYKSIWMHPEERAFMSAGRTKDAESGRWLSGMERKRLIQGWSLQDQEWIAPADTLRSDRGEWLVRGEWLQLPDANKRHSRIDSMWHIPGQKVLLHSTADRHVALKALHAMERALADLGRVFGAEPLLPLNVCVLRDQEQYDRFAFGAPDGRRLATHVGRLQVLRSAFFAESWFEHMQGRLQYNGMGVCYWDALEPYGDLYGVHAARFAVGLSYVEALDPSPKSIRKAGGDGPDGDYYEAFLAEKKLPKWLRYGAAVYAERYFRDDTVPEDGDPWWARNWSLGNLQDQGGLGALDELFECRLDPDEREVSQKLFLEVGLAVAFIVDGGCPELNEAHAELKTALASGRLRSKHITGLQEALIANEVRLRAFAQVPPK